MATVFSQLDIFTKSYVETALWSSLDDHGNNMDENFGVVDIDPETLSNMERDCRNFMSDNHADITDSGLAWERAGYNFWLTRNGHGTGFWDEYFQDSPERSACMRLTNASKAYGSFELYVGDNGVVHGA